VIVKFVDDEPCGMFTVGGGATTPLVDERETFAPPAGAAPLIHTVPVTLDPPVTSNVAKPIKTSGTIVTVPWAEPLL
jgi:hypothetical protein